MPLTIDCKTHIAYSFVSNIDLFFHL